MEASWAFGAGGLPAAGLGGRAVNARLGPLGGRGAAGRPVVARGPAPGPRPPSPGTALRPLRPTGLGAGRRSRSVRGVSAPGRAEVSPAWAWAVVAGCRMNCRSEVLEVTVEGRQVEEAMLAVLHTVLLHRSTGKFHYKKEGTYSIGTVGTQDVDCDFIDFTYVRVSSDELDRALRKVVGEFKEALRNSGGDGLGQISLEFYQKKKSRWPFSDECIPWEVWTVKVHVVALATEQERQICREKVGEKLCEKLINIVEVMNRHEYLPKMPTQSEVDNVFDTGLRDVQPYLYKISFQITDALGTSVTTTMRRLIKDTLAL
ncbi:autophagy-related protein 101 isoform X1 [Ochotona curzoniae]|uniref:autophagy-related protein 101 isoform X1 n=2 Tax=Ochotona curzoniae TaxID=130825 RepID=UPI001B34DE89|nr:autophagy-related protein 101 isoform X1 [Ochotona curzoniae]